MAFSSIALGLMGSAAFAFCGAGVLAISHMFARMRFEDGTIWGKLFLSCWGLAVGGICIAGLIGVVLAPSGDNAIKSAEGYYLGFALGCFLVWRYIRRQY